MRSRPYAAEVRTLAERIWRSGGERRELSQGLIALLLAALQYLRRAGGEQERALLGTIAGSEVHKPNRIRAKESAQALLAA